MIDKDKDDGLDNWCIRKDGKGDEVNEEHAKGLNVKQMHPYSSFPQQFGVHPIEHSNVVVVFRYLLKTSQAWK